jgi:hypothetical protein
MASEQQKHIAAGEETDATDPYISAYIESYTEGRNKSWLALNTLRGRFLYLAITLFVAMYLVALVIDYRLQSASGENATNLAERYRASELTRSISNRMWEAEQTLQGFLLLPGPEERRHYTALLDQVIHDVEAFAATNWIKENRTLRGHTTALSDDLRALRTEVGTLMDVRVRPERMFPAMPIMVERMQPRCRPVLHGCHARPGGSPRTTRV